MEKVDDVIARVRAFRIMRGWAPSRFSLNAGLSVNALRDINAAGWDPRAGTLRQLETIIPDDFQADT